MVIVSKKNISVLKSIFSVFYREKYDEINPIQMASIAEDIVRILAEIEAGSDAVNYVNGFIYFIHKFKSFVNSSTFFQSVNSKVLDVSVGPLVIHIINFIAYLSKNL